MITWGRITLWLIGKWLCIETLHGLEQFLSFWWFVMVDWQLKIGYASLVLLQMVNVVFVVRMNLSIISFLVVLVWKSFGIRSSVRCVLIMLHWSCDGSQEVAKEMGGRHYYWKVLLLKLSTPYGSIGTMIALAIEYIIQS
jgi:hypothetical protein